MKKFLLVFLFIPFCLMKSAWAACTVSAPVSTTPMPLQLGNMTAGNDNFSVGKILYRQTYNLDFTGKTAVTCNTSNSQFVAVYSFSNTPSGGPLPGSIGSIPAGKVYPTNLAGIGVYIRQGTNSGSNLDTYAPTTKIVSDQTSGIPGCSSGNVCNVIDQFKRWDLYLVQTGPISAGTLNGSSLPCLQVNFNNTGSSSDGLIENICIQGQINIVSPSCTTPDVTVDLGTHAVTELSGSGSATPWVDSSIRLLNCTSFYGNGSSGNWFIDGSGSNSSGTPNKNNIGLVLQSSNITIIDDVNGIFAINTGSSSAKGVGIQLGYGTTASQVEFVKFDNETKYPQDLNSSGTVTLPLVARYIQTDSNVTPGKADASITYLINYY